MGTADTTRMAAADDTRGRLVVVYHNAGHVRLESGDECKHVDLTIEAARVIINGLADAVTEARLWELEQAVAADTAAELEELEQIREYRRP